MDIFRPKLILEVELSNGGALSRVLRQGLGHHTDTKKMLGIMFHSVWGESVQLGLVPVV